MPDYAIEMRHIHYKNKNLNLDDIHFNVPRGYITGLVGANGSGKTTMIRLIMNVLQPQQGEIKIFNQSLLKNEVFIKEKIGFVYSELYVNEKWTVKKLVETISYFYNQWDQAKFMNYLTRFNIKYHSRINTLSLGMKMKLSLAIALSHHAELLIFDEPMNGLDPVVRKDLMRIIQEELLDENKSVFMSTHIISDLEEIVDYIIHLKNGKIIVNESKDVLLATHKRVKGSLEDLDDEIKALMLQYDIIGEMYVGMTKEAHVFKELFGERVVISPMTIEEIMVHYENIGKEEKECVDFC